MTKYEEKLVSNYERATATSLSEIYKKPSSKKVDIYLWLLDYVKKLDGYGIKLPKHTANEFSFAFKVNIEDRTYLYYITKCNEYHILLNK